MHLGDYLKQKRVEIGKAYLKFIFIDYYSFLWKVTRKKITLLIAE